MKKSKIVSYSSEELKQLPDESDWAAADAMTEEEIKAAIASDPDETTSGDEWMRRGFIVRNRARFVMYINSDEVSDDLILHKVYKDTATPDEHQRQWVRVVNEHGQDDLYAAGNFVPVYIPIEAEPGFEAVTA